MSVPNIFQPKTLISSTDVNENFAYLDGNITAETARAEGAEATLSAAIASETTRAEGTEATLSTAISDETTRAEGVEATKAGIDLANLDTAGDTVIDGRADARVQAAKGTADPLVNGMATPGTSAEWAPIDHVHPTDTTRAGINEENVFSQPQFYQSDLVSDNAIGVGGTYYYKISGKNAWAIQHRPSPSANYIISRFDYTTDTFISDDFTISHADGTVQIPRFSVGDSATYGYAKPGNLTSTAYRTYWEINSPKVTYTLQDWWPGTNDAEAYIGVAHAVDASTPVAATHPVSAIAALCTHNDGSPDVAAVGVTAGAVVNNSTSVRQAVGVNAIAQTGQSDAHLTCVEGDCMAPSGFTGFGAGFIANPFTGPLGGPAYLAGSGDGIGLWRSAFEVSNSSIVSGNGAIRPYPDASTASYFIDSSTGGGFSGAFIRAYGDKGVIEFTDGSGNANGKLQGNSGGRDVLLLLQDSSSAFRVQSNNGTETNEIASFREGVTFTDSAVFYNAVGGGANAAATALSLQKNSTTSRSINAGGTINASGADYAEYRKKSSSCGVVTKGQVVGLDKDGKLTDKWSLVCSNFFIKSTAPNLVGGDFWDEDLLLEKPIPPTAPINPGEAPKRLPDPARKNMSAGKHAQIRTALDEKHAIEIADWQKKVDDYNAELLVYAEALAKHKRDYAAWTDKYEGIRQTVDRIAMCGFVPANVLSATPGQVITVREGAGDTIEMVAVDMTRSLHPMEILGNVTAIMPDGRAEICINPNCCKF